MDQYPHPNVVPSSAPAPFVAAKLKPNKRFASCLWRLGSVFLLTLAALLLAFLTLLGLPQSLWAAGPLYVASSGSDSGYCTLSAPCRTIQYAVSVASSGDEIRVAAGVYPTVTLNTNVTLRGGFTTANWLTPNPQQNLTVIDAQGSGRPLEVNGSVTALVFGFDLTGGNVSADGGGGVYNRGTLTLDQCRIFDNRDGSGNGGGGIANHAGAALVVKNSQVYSNTSRNISDGEGLGGGIAVFGGTALLEGNKIFSNTVIGFGGGVYVPNGSATIKNNLIYNNVAAEVAVGTGYGGGAFIQGNTYLENNTFYKNTADNNGGGIYVYLGTMAITNSLIISNIASISGGIVNDSSTVSVAYTDFFGNSSDDGFTSGTGNRTGQNPQFVNPANYDLHLSAGSPAIDTGTSNTTVTTDFEGQGRPFGAGIDRGADEVTTSSTCYARIDRTGQVYTSLSTAITDAIDGDTIRVAGRCQPISLTENLTVRGGYTVTDWLNARYGPTILDGGGSVQVVNVSGSAAITLENLYITGGSAVDGAGVYLNSSGPATLRNNVIYGNTAANNGGGVYNIGSGNVDLQHNTIYNNTAGASGQGGGVYAHSSGGTVTLRNSIIANNVRWGVATTQVGRLTSDYNDYYGNTVADANGVTFGVHDLFVDPTVGPSDFHLPYNSRLIDAADPASGVSTDFENDARPQGGRPDIGADESASYPGVQLSDAPNHVVTDIGAVLGQPITFTHTITNTGFDPGLSNTFSLTVTNSEGWQVSLVGITTPTVTLDSGDSLTFDVVVWVPGSLPGGIYNQTTITVADQNNPAVSDTATDLISSPGAQLTPNYNDSAQPGDILTYTHILTNVGQAIDSFDVQLISSRGWSQLVGVTNPITLSPGASTLITVSVRVTNTAPANIFDVSRVIATSVNYGISATAVDTTTAKATIGDRYVATTGHDTDNNCTQNPSPCATINYAVGQAAFSDTVKVAGGVYNEAGININQFIRLRGGFSTGDWTTPNPAANQTTIDAQSGGRPLLINVYLGPNFRPTVEGFTIRNGNGDGGIGGAIYVQGSSAPTLTQLIILDSSATQGGGIYLENGNSVLQGITISNTTASVYGGGIYQNSGTVTITATRITGARAGNSGGGFYSAGGVSNLWNNFIDNNTATSGSGGGVYKGGGTLSLVNDTIANNQAATSGGGVATVSSSGIISNNIVVSNTAATGGGIYRSGGAVTANYNDVWNNTGGNYSGLAAGPNDISANPRFVDEANGNLHLTSASPATDRGDPNTFLKTDFDHDRRPSNQGYDMGADELQGCLARIEGDPTNTIYDILQQAVDLAPNSGAVQISGICLGAKPRLVSGQVMTQTVVVTKNLALKGGYNSTFSNDPNTSPEPTILDALSQGRTLVVTNSVGVTLSHLTLTGGDAAAGGRANAGGGIYNGGAQLIVGSSLISGNQATIGGGIYVLTGTLTLGGMNAATSTQVFSNTATDGGGLYVQTGSALITHTFFASNTASQNGGGLYNSGGLVAVQILSATHNIANNGGAVYNAAGGGLTLVNALVFSNTATNGAGLYNLSESLAVRHDTFYANHATNQGGAIYNDANTSAPIINSTLLVSNTAGYAGGAIDSPGAAPTFRYNDLFNNVPANFTPDSTNLSVSPNLLSTDPALPTFLHLSGGSPIEDRGDPTSPVDLDYDKDPRPSNQNFDIGADEVGGCFVRVNAIPVTYGNIMVAIRTLPPTSGLNDVVKVAGTCQGVQPIVDGGQTVSQTVFLTQSLTLRGGYNKDNWDETPDPAVYTTTLDALNLGRVVYVTNSAVISMGGFQVRQGTAVNGGAVFVGSGVFTLSNSSIYSSTAANGGVGYNAGGTFILDSNRIYGNQATNGGAFYHAAGESILQNNIIRDNTATDGGGIYNNGVGLTVRHNTLYANSATNGGGFYTADANPVVVNNIFAYNTATSGHAIYGPAGFAPNYNDTYHPSLGNPYGGGASGAAAGNLTSNPLLVAPAVGDFHLQPTSPVLDVGDPAMTLYHDFEGDYRPGDQGFDMGADEQASCRARVQSTGIIYGNIQRAVDNSQQYDTIQVSVGECRGVHPYFDADSGQTFTQTVHIRHNLTLHGGFALDFTSGGDSGPSTYPDSNASTINPMNLGRAVLITNSARITMLRFILTNGNAVAGGGGSGGGLYFNGNGGRLEHVNFYSNTATLGGGFFNAGTNFEMFNSWMHNNSATDGGAVYNATGAMTITGEIAPDPSMEENTVMRDNRATNRGGAIFNDSGTLRVLSNSYIVDSTYDPLRGNRANQGGFAFNNTGVMILENNAISNNQANQGGAIYNNSGALTLDRGNRLYRNETLLISGLGGAIFNSGNLTAWNTFIYGNNNTFRGAGIYLAGGSNSSILHNTFYLNEAAERGGGIYVAGGTATIWANIFDTQTASIGNAINAGIGPSLDYNDYYNSGSVPVAGGVISGTHNFSVFPNFEDASTTGGANFHLDEESELIDVGPYPDLGVPHDFENDPRPINTYPDIGADEYNACLARLVSNGHIYGRIQDAVNDAQAGDTIDVAEGVCEESVTIASNLTINGSWLKDFSRRYDEPAIRTTIQAPAVISNRVMLVQGSVSSFNMSQIELTNGRTNANGGGLYLGNGARGIVLEYVDIDNNWADNGGGVYAGLNVEADFFQVSLSDNQALTGNGGGMYSDSGSDIYVTGGSDRRNRARNGGEFYNNGATFEIRNKWAVDNEATNGDGGGVYADSASSIKLTNLLLYSNTATGNGGGIYNASAGAAIYHSTINNNQAAGQGGGVYNTGLNSVISASIVSFNTSGGANGIHSLVSMDAGRTLRSPDTTYNGVAETNQIVADPNYLFLPFTPEGAFLQYTSPAIDAVPTPESDVNGDAYLVSRPQICDKDMGVQEYYVPVRTLTWGNPPTSTVTISPTESVTYTFVLTNNSENWFDPWSISSRGPGTGYTETITLTLNSTQPWGQQFVAISGGFSPTIISNTVATVALGPGEAVTMSVRVTVPPGTFADVVDVTTVSYTSLQVRCNPQVGTSGPATTRVLQSRKFIIAPDLFGAALPGETITYTHLITNLGNLTDTYLIYPAAPLYASGEIIYPLGPTFTVTLGPLQTSPITMWVTVDSRAAGGLLGWTNVTGQSLGDPTLIESAIDTTAISYTTGTRHVSLDGLDKFEPNGPTDKDNNCTQGDITPCRTIQQAINQAAPGDLIKIEQGVYNQVYTDILTTTYKGLELTQIAIIDKSITLQGGYEKDMAGGWDENPPNHTVQTTTLDLNGNPGRGIFVTEGVTATIDRLTIVNGNADNGGAICNEGGNLTLSGLALRNNLADQGAALYSDNGNLVVQNSLLYNNHATSRGGAIYINAGTASLQHDTFFNNQANQGGGIYLYDIALTITNTIFATHTGSAVYIQRNTTPTMDHNLFVGNTPADYVQNGGVAPLPGAGNVLADPMFVNPLGNPPDLNLQRGSPALEQNTAGLPIDYANTSRPQNALYDLGAYERPVMRGLLFYSDTVTSTMAGGPPIVITHVLSNTGELTETVTITAASTLPWVIDFDQSLPYTISLPSLVSRTVVVTYHVPPGSEGQSNTTLITASTSLTTLTRMVTDVINVRSVNWQIDKTVTPTPTVQAGGLLTYTLTVRNVGDLDSVGTFTVTDELPNDTDFVSASDGGVLSGSTTVQWVTDTTVLSNNGSMSFSYVVSVTRPLTDGASIVNQTYAITGGGAPNPATGSPVTVTVTAPATVTLTKTASHSPVQPGDILTYTLTLTNNSESLGLVVNPVITDILPAEVVYQDMGFVPPAIGISSGGGSILSWDLTQPITPGASAQVTVTVRVTSPLAANTILTNSYGVTVSNIAAPVAGLLPTPVTATNTITLQKTVVPTQTGPGGTVTYTIILSNTGDGIATVNLTDTLAAGFTPATFNTSVIVPGRTWSASAGSASVSFTATAPITAGVYSNTLITAAYDVTETTLSNTAPVTVETPLAGLSLSKTPDLQLVQSGGTAVFTFTLVNTGNVALNPITIIDPLATDCEQTTVGTLPISGTISYICSRGNITTSFTNIATATTTGVVGGQPVTATDTATVTVISPAIDISKTPDDQPARSGDTVTFTITISNTGDITLTNVTVSDAQAPDCNRSVGDLTTVGLSSTHSYTCTMVVTTDITNTATAVGTPPVGPTVSDSDDAFVNVISPAIQVNKMPDVQYVLSGDTVTFTITVSNTGDSDLANVTVNDDQAANCDDRNLGTLIAGSQPISYTCSVAVTTDLTNTATVTGTPPLGPDVSASDDAFVNVISPSIQITKTPDLQTILRDDPVTFTITVQNTGDSPLANVTVVDAEAAVCDRSLGSLDSGALTSYTCMVTSATQSFTNTALVTGTPPAGPEVSASDEARVNVIGPNLRISKLPSSQDIVSGSLVTFTIIVTNTGDVTLTTVTITDNAAPICNRTFTDVLSGTFQSYECPIGSVTADLTNTVIATGVHAFGQIVDSSTATVNVAEPGISVVKSPDSQYVLSGGTVTFTIDITNTGDVNLSPITVTDVLAPNCTGIYNTLIPLFPGSRGTYPYPSCTLAGVTADFTNTVVVTAGTTISTEIAASDDAFVDVITPAITIAKTPDTQVIQSGSPAVFTITVTNSGDITLTNIQVDDALATDCSRPNLGNLAAGDSTTYTCSRSGVTAAFTNTAVVSGTSPLNIVTHVDTATVTVITPALAIFKTPDFQVANNGDTVTFTVTVSNTGDVTLAPITITDVLAPDCDRVVPALLPGEHSTQTCEMVVGTIDITNTAVATGVPPVGPVVVTSDTAFVDTTPPARPRLLSPANLSYTNNPTVTFSWLPAADTFTYTLWVSGTTYDVLAPTSSHVLPGLAEGVYTWTVRSVDAYSRTLGYTDSWTVTVDTTPPPAPTLITPTNGMTVTGQPTFDWSDVTDTMSGPVSYTIVISGVGSFGSATSNFTMPVTLSPGVYSWTVYAHDQAGNTSAPSTTYTFIVEAPISLVYLPLIINGAAGALPDLRPVQLTVQPATGLGPTTPVVLTVVVQNVGTAASPANFWVDFYINPSSFPNEAGHVWSSLVCDTCPGLAWQVRRSLAPGESVTLTSVTGDPYLVPAYTRWPGYFNQSGPLQLGAYVDSWDGTNKPQGFVLESNETNNLITRFDVTVAGAGANSVDESEFKPIPDRPRPQR